MTCGSATRIAMTQLDAPKVCALTISSCGTSSTRWLRSRMMNGRVPTTISTTLDNSPSPKIMKRIGSSANGGIIDRTATNCARKLRINGRSPISSPTINPIRAEIPMPRNSRCKLAQVSCQNRIRSLRRSGSVISRQAVSAMDEGAGSSLSEGFAASRISEPMA